jgi:uncharacterized membrane protein
MRTASVSAPQANWLRAKYVLFAFLGLMLGYVLWHDESFLINARDPEWQHIQTFRWYLLPHGIAGACALLLASMQFSDRLRSKYAKLHRVVGRIYIGGVLIGAPMGVFIQHFEERIGESRSFTVATVFQATSWILTTLIALILIRQGKVDAHRRWMTRSFSVALVFLEVRVVLGVMGWDDSGPGVAEMVVWGCNVFAWMAADIVLQCQEWLRSRPIRHEAKAAAD